MKIFVFLGLTFLICVNCKRRNIERQACQNPPTQMVYDSGWVSIPNIITPNGDGVNDYLFVNIVGYQYFSIDIRCKKNGKSIYHSNDPYTGWEGHVNKKIKEGLYYYDFSILTVNNENITGSGDVTVVINSGDYCISNGTNCSGSSSWNGTEFVDAIDPEIIECN